MLLVDPQFVASFTGAWIETIVLTLEMSIKHVASFTGAWIETSVRYVSPHG